MINPNVWEEYGYTFEEWVAYLTVKLKDAKPEDLQCPCLVVTNEEDNEFKE